MMLESVSEYPSVEGDLVLMRVDNVAAVTGIVKCGRASDKRAGLTMRTLGRFEIKGRWSHTAKYIPGTQNVLTDGISQWPRRDIDREIRELTNTDDWSERRIEKTGEIIFSLVLESSCVTREHDEILWNLMATGPGDA